MICCSMLLDVFLHPQGGTISVRPPVPPTFISVDGSGDGRHHLLPDGGPSLSSRRHRFPFSAPFAPADLTLVTLT